MKYLTIEQRERLQRDLQNLAERLRAEFAGRRKLANHSQETDDDAVADLEGDLDIADLERDAKALEAVEAALKRIHEPGFGVCADCEEDIPFARLAANPASMRCIACQTKHERATGAALAPKL
ncbi:MAG: TraR/DksA family transcriptional regulator [Betaproteobacteria bacterium]